MRSLQVVERSADEYSDPDTWDRLRSESSARAKAVALQLLSSGPNDVVALAQITLGQIAMQHGDEHATLHHMHIAQRVEPVSPLVAFRVQLSVAALLVRLRQHDDARALLDAMAPRNRAELVRWHIQTSWVDEQAGRLDEGIRHLTLAEDMLSGVDSEMMSRLLLSRSAMLVQVGHLAPALDDAERAGVIAERYGQRTTQSMALGNQAVALARMRRFDEAFQRFDAAELIANDPPTAAMIAADRAEALLLAGLFGQAIEAARAAMRLADAAATPSLIADAYRVGAGVELAGGSLRSAVRVAEEGIGRLAEFGQPGSSSRLRSLMHQARLRLAADPDAVLMSDIDDTIVELQQLGWLESAAELRHARLAYRQRLDDFGAADDDIRALVVDGQRDGGPIVSLRARYATALSHALAGSPDRAIAECFGGLTEVDEIAVRAEDIEERSAARAVGADLSQLIVDIAIDTENVDFVFGASEGTRARSLDDEVERAESTDRLSVEAASELAEHVRRQLGERILVSWVESRGRLWALRIDRTGRHLDPVCRTVDLEQARDRVLAWLDRAAHAPGGSVVRVQRALADLIGLLRPAFPPAGADVVVVPARSLHGLPWGAIAVGAGFEALVAAPSIRMWLAADRRPTTSAGVVMVIGPDMTHAAEEAQRVERTFADVQIADGDDADIDGLRRALGGERALNIAAHGQFESARPLLSTLRLADGEKLLRDAVPETVSTPLVTLSSCEGSAHSGSAGGEVLGLGALLLSRGALSVVGPLSAVSDQQCGWFVASLYERLATGEEIGQAVTRLQRQWLDSDDLARWGTAASFVALGTGSVRLVI